jgi:Mor family transcriptional regulator
MNTVELGIKYGCSDVTITKTLKDNNVYIRTSGESKTINLPMEKIINEYNNGMSGYEIGIKYNCSNSTIYRKLRENNIDIKSSIDLPTKKIISEYNNGMTIEELGEKYKCNSITIYNRIKNNDGKIRTIKESHNTLLTYICIECGRKFEGKLNSLYCPKCNSSGYCYKYNNECREHNRKKYNNECFFCGITENEIGRKLDTHHIDNNKNQGCDNTPNWRLVPLCNSCHGITKGGKENREVWKTRIIWLLDNVWN